MVSRQHFRDLPEPATAFSASGSGDRQAGKRNKSDPQGSGYAGLPLDRRQVLMYLPAPPFRLLHTKKFPRMQTHPEEPFHEAENLLLLRLGDGGPDLLPAALQVGLATTALFNLVALLSHFSSFDPKGFFYKCILINIATGMRNFK